MIRIKSKQLPKDFVFLLSGGVDSVAAAHWLKHNYNRNFCAIHFNHGVQKINDEMEEKVRTFCRDNQIPLSVYYRDSYLFPDVTENGLRKFRLEVINNIGGDFVTAHHLNDAVENYVMNFIKGIPDYKPIQEVSVGGAARIYHPFLRVNKKSFIDFAARNNLGEYIIEDPTNKESICLRNKIRNVIIPEFNKISDLESVVKRRFYPDFAE